MQTGSKRLAAACLAVVLGLLWGSGALGSRGTLLPGTALAGVDAERGLMFTTRFCEPGRCLDAHVGVTRSGRADLPVLIGAPGQTITFTPAFVPVSLRLTVHANGVETTTTLTDATWQIPDDLALPASLRLEASGESQSGTFLAIVDRTAPAPFLDQARVRVAVAQGKPVFDLRFRLCSQQTGAVEIHLTEKRRAGTRRVAQVLPNGHIPGCSTYRFAQPSPWARRGAAGQLTLRARVARSQLSSPLSLLQAANS